MPEAGRSLTLPYLASLEARPEPLSERCRPYTQRKGALLSVNAKRMPRRVLLSLTKFPVHHSISHLTCHSPP